MESMGKSLSRGLTAFSFLSNVPKRTHFVLFHENEKRAFELELWYLISGMLKGENAIYVTRSNPDYLRRSMKEFNLDTKYFEEDKRLLHIRLVKDPAKYPSGFIEGMREMYRTIFEGVVGPLRVVGNSVPVVQTREVARMNLKVESSAQDAFLDHEKTGNRRDSPYNVFHDFDGSVMCHYAVDTRNGSDIHRRWILENSKNHSNTIFVPRESNSQALVFEGS
jgi:hypothetical protein